MKKYIYTLILLGISSISFSQNEGSMLDLLGTEETTEYARHAFKSPRVINSHSMEMLAAGALDFRILHRFGEISGGAYEMFGLDNATMRMSFDYGLTEDATIGIGRSTRNKELDAFVKYRIFHQSTGRKVMPISLIWVSGLTYNTLRDPYPGEEVNVSRRTAYYHQVILDRYRLSR